MVIWPFMGVVNSSTCKISLEMDAQCCITSQIFTPPQMKRRCLNKTNAVKKIFTFSNVLFAAIGGYGMS